MLIGVLLGIAAGALWGLIYIAPASCTAVQPRARGARALHLLRIVSLPCLWFLRQDSKKFTRADIWGGVQASVLRQRDLLLDAHDLHPHGGRPSGRHVHGRDSGVGRHRLQRPLREGRARDSLGRILPPLAVIFAGLVIANWSNSR